MNKLTFTGIKENNLKNLNLEFEHNKLIVITGLSGSGKSSLAFDTIYAEGGRRYIETFSPYTRQFLERLPQPNLDSAKNVRPALILRQHNQVTSSRSTVGTLTEINEYLKIIWANTAIKHCPKCGIELSQQSPGDILKKILQATKKQTDSYLLICFQAKLQSFQNLEKFKNDLISKGFIRFFNPQTNSIEKIENLDLETVIVINSPGTSKKETEITIIIDRIVLPSTQDETRLFDSLQQALQHGNHEIEVITLSKTTKVPSFHQRYTTKALCPTCKTVFETPNPNIFSFNNPLGACEKCSGFGKILKVDPALVVPDPNKSLSAGAIACWATPAAEWERTSLKKFCKKNNISMTDPWHKLSKKVQRLILTTDDEDLPFYSVESWFEWLSKARHKIQVRVLLARYKSEFVCPACAGNRLKENVLSYKVQGFSLPQIWQMTISELTKFIASLEAKFASNKLLTSVLHEVQSRLKYLIDIGLGYLTLDRPTKTLSGGEAQRVNLTSILGSRLTNLTIVLDEPTIGLHQTDTQKLIQILKLLRDRGNTVFVVEHDKEVIAAADEVLDLGPKSGKEGGNVVFQGTVKDLLNYSNSLTAKHLAQPVWSSLTKAQHAKAYSAKSKNFLSIYGCHANNLKNIDLHIPLNKFVVLSGVSGSGKSSLLRECIYKKQALDKIEGLENISDIIFVDQTPLVKSPRSNPATYTKIWDDIRSAFASTESAIAQGLSKASFSFNVEGGRCPTCQGAGYNKIEMQFLANVYVLCDTCNGLRFQDSILTVKYLNKTIADFLNMTLDETYDLFLMAGETQRANQILAKLTPLRNLGLGYLKLGQAISQLSGGEAQRLKLAKHLDEQPCLLGTSKNSKFEVLSSSQVRSSLLPVNKGLARRSNNEAVGISRSSLFLLDEPTSGLHAENIKDLLATFRYIINAGHSILCIEHNTDVIMNADWVIDLGPEAGSAGGEIVAKGDPYNLVEEYQRVISKEGSNSSKLKSKTIKAIIATPASTPAAPIQSRATNQQAITIYNAKQNNLKNLTVKIPLNSYTIITGVSGSGKSSLAFDILFAEGQRRYIDCLSPYARHFLTKIKPAEVENIEALPPTIAVSQKTTSVTQKNSTVATVSEIYQYLRLLYAKVGVQYCPEHQQPVISYSVEQIVEEVLQKTGRIFVFAPVIVGRKGSFVELFERALKAEITQAKIDDEFVTLSEDLKLNKNQRHWISLQIAEINGAKFNADLLADAIKQALALTGGTVEVTYNKRTNPTYTYSTQRVCPSCKRGFRALDPQDFSFQGASSACEKCSGAGIIQKNKTIITCPECNGARLKELGRSVFIAGKSIFALTQMTAPKLRNFLHSLKFQGSQDVVAQPILKELLGLLNIMCEIGLDYIELCRPSLSISGGEAQRLRLARALGSPLTGVCYVLDEPSIGLHPRDNQLIIKIIRALRDRGNTVVVVEHDPDFIQAADYLIDLGPGGGATGGAIVAQGNFSEFMKYETSTTVQCLTKLQQKAAPQAAKAVTKSAQLRWLSLYGCRTNNLKNIDVRFPTNSLTAVCGVSGAGKSSLVYGTLLPAICQKLKINFGNSKVLSNGEWNKLTGWEQFQNCITIEQAPISKNSNSSPASYLGILDEIRKIFAMTNEAKINGLTAAYFSYNTGKGKCATCGGKGFVTMDLGFLPSMATLCEACQGGRYNEQALKIKFQGLSISEVLKLTISDALVVFKNHKLIKRSLEYAHELGLGYLVLGQPTYTLSGGEAQRIKIATELGRTNANNTLYVLDEPTIGLHMNDVNKLISVLKKLVAKGNTVICIEHDQELIAEADYVIEMGPGAGVSGGYLSGLSGTGLHLR
ncbi:MAG: excinuclease ABC subunit UvrA [Deltaproteobacteria bacterium]|jgi:excinuclease ABC subunit A|nr:excinuclease ABC subunit UvrA [Deltaproteobacteria bacterium]